MRNTFENTEHTIVGLFISCSRSLLTLLLLVALEVHGGSIHMLLVHTCY